MESTDTIEMILIDFDGVISKNAVSLILKASYEFVNNLNPIPFPVYENLFKHVISFPLNDTLHFICKSFGLERQIHELASLLKHMGQHKGELLTIENEFFDFIHLCNKTNTKYLIVSSADKSSERFSRVIERIGDQHIYDLKDKSKASIATFKGIIKDTSVAPEKTVYIEDSPIALKTAKLTGINTIMMLNRVFTMDDYLMFDKYIDKAVTSFIDIAECIFNEKIKKSA